MISLNAKQTKIMESSSKNVEWLFWVVDNTGTNYRWSLNTVEEGISVIWDGLTWDGLTWDDIWATSYTAKILEFNGITLRRPKTESKIIAPNVASFRISNKSNSINPADLIGGTVTIALRVSDHTDTAVIRSFGFNIKKVEPGYQELNIICEDFFSQYLDGDYPNTPYSADVFPTTNVDDNSKMTIPQPFGVCYVPLKGTTVPDADPYITDTVSVVAGVDGTYPYFLDSSVRFTMKSRSYMTVSGFTETNNNGYMLCWSCLYGPNWDENKRTNIASVRFQDTPGGNLVTEVEGDTVTFSEDKTAFILGPTAISSNLNLPSNQFLVGYWAFNEGSGTIAIDGSGNGNDGTLTNMEEADWVDGVSGKCLNFGGTDEYVDCGDGSNLSFGTGNFSVSFWAKSTVNGYNQYMIAKGEFGGVVTGFGVLKYNTNYFKVWIGDNTNQVLQDSLVAYTDTDWHHFAISIDKSGNQSFYIDSILQATDAVDYSDIDYAVNLHIAARAGTGNFTGSIDEVRIYNSALTATEVKALYTTPNGIGESVTYDITGVRTPRALAEENKWDHTGLDAQFSALDRNSDTWRLFQPFIADPTNRGLDDTVGFFKIGSNLLDLPTRFSRSDTQYMTNPADVIKFVLLDIGVPSTKINTTMFDAARLVYADWGLEFNGAFWEKASRNISLSMLLNMCHSTLTINQQVGLKVLSNVSQMEISSDDVYSGKNVGKGSFVFRASTNKSTYNAGYVHWQQDNDSQDAFIKTITPAKSSYTSISSEILSVPFVQDSQNVQKIGSLYFQRKLLQDGTISFTGRSYTALLEPDDFITINHSDYGGNYPVLVDEINIMKDLRVNLVCSNFSDTMDDWEDLSPDAVVFTADNTALTWQPVTGGPESTKAVGNSAFEVWGDPYIVVGPSTLKARYTDLQTAISGLSESQHSEILLLDGEYQLTAPIYLPDRNITIKGESRNAIIKNSPGQHGFVLPNLTSTFIFENFIMSSQNTSSYSYMIYVYGDTAPENTSEAFLKKITFNCADSGLANSTGDFAVRSNIGDSLVDIRECNINGGSIGLSILSDSCHIDSCNIDSVLSTGISVLTSSGGKVAKCKNNYLSNMYYQGILFSSDTIAAEISNNIVEAVLTSAIHSSFVGISSSSKDSFISKNLINFNNTTENTNIIGLTVSLSTGVLRPHIDGNTINIIANSTVDTYGISCFSCIDASVVGNTIKIDNSNGASNHYGIGIGGFGAYNGLRNRVSNNGIDMVNNAGVDCGILLTSLSQDCQGSDNITYNVGTSISDSGTNNTVIAKDV